MSRSSSIIAVVAALVVVSGLLYVSSAQPVDIFRLERCSLITPRLVQYSYSDQRDLCLEDCRDAYGSWFGFGSSNYAYARCVQDCENRFWHEFDRSMRELEKEEKTMK